MQYRRLGNSGLAVSAIGIGCNNFGAANDETATKAVVHKALDVGITLFDTADSYGGRGKSEEFLGKALGARRKDVVIATKFGWAMGDNSNDLGTRGGASRDYIMRAVEGSLRRLGTDYIDLYQMHLPDPQTPIAETLGALADLVRQGKVRYIGHSNLAGWQIANAAWSARSQRLPAFVSAQNRYSVLSREIEAEVAPACEAFGLGILPFFPLESGLLSGKYRRGEAPKDGTRWATWAKTRPPAQLQRFFSDTKLEQAEKLEALMQAAGVSMLELAFGWLLGKPYVSSVIAGATSPAQVEANAKAGLWRPDAEVAAKIDAISPKPPAP